MTWLERQWQSRTLGAALLFPIAVLYAMATTVRRSLYRSRLMKSERLPVPVVVVGNIMVGGTGKTPLVLWLAAWLQSQGYRPGIVTRGYGGTSSKPSAVGPGSNPAQFGDEAVLLAARSACPVWAGAKRAEAGFALLAAHPQCDVIVSDDGLQHYGLHRDVEIAVIDAARGHGNGWLLPAGPLREPASRLDRVDAIVVHGDGAPAPHGQVPAYGMRLRGQSFYNLADRQRRAGPDYFVGKSVHAVAGIGNPQRFFAHLDELGMRFSPHPYPDHHLFRPEDLAYEGAEAIVMTEKDAVKCQAFATDRCWVLPVDAEVDPRLGALVTRKLESL
ncbi:MAG: tetraacyldisaccharide 4'-kinase [Rhodospirillaceae bacterium]